MARCHIIRSSFRGYGAYEKVEAFFCHVLKFFVADQDEVDTIAIAVREAVLNAVEHGNAAGMVRVQVKIWQGGRISVRVKDWGAGFDAAPLINQLFADPKGAFDQRVAQGRGWGLLLIRQAMDKMLYNKCGNEILIAKSIEVQQATACS